ncbi:hypothetical protein GCK32_007985 [Trichostrongylus colubriformis]|uniref:Uncharacterized protein n=1 Tax=Trichostrongylus colubriformis TaxID=6319 RepID=A0AAN8ENI7_TRICO
MVRMTEKSKSRKKLSKVLHLLMMSKLKPEKQEEMSIENIMDEDEKKEETVEKSSSDEKKGKMVQKKTETIEKSSGEKKAKKDQKKYETVEKSSSDERKAKKVQGKYGAAPEAAIEQKKDAEEFEKVNVTVRPAQPKMRTATLRWKSGEYEDTVDDSIEQLSAEAVTNSPSPQPSIERKSPSSSAESRTQTAERVNTIRQKSENERSLADIPILLKRIAELESAQSKSIMTQKRLRLRLRDRERTIKELTDALNAPSPAVKTIDEEDKPVRPFRCIEM